MRKIYPSVLSCHKHARNVLRGRFNLRLLTFTLTGLCFFAFCGICAAVYALFSALRLGGTPFVYGICVASALLVSGFFIAPLWEGCESFFCFLTRYEKTRTERIFCFFTSRKRYFWALGRYVRRVLRTVIFYFLFLLVCRMGGELSSYLLRSGADVRGSLVLASTLLFLGLLVLLAYRFSVRVCLVGAVGFSAPTLSLRQAAKVSALSLKHRYGKVLILHFTFLPMFIFSILFFGIPFLFVLSHYFAAKAKLSLDLLAVENGMVEKGTHIK